MSNYAKELAKFIKKRLGPEAKHMQAVPVRVLVEGNLVWDAAIEVIGRPATGHGWNANFNWGCSWD
jgi:hypothetical protein